MYKGGDPLNGAAVEGDSSETEGGAFGIKCGVDNNNTSTTTTTTFLIKLSSSSSSSYLLLLPHFSFFPTQQFIEKVQHQRSLYTHTLHTQRRNNG